eukprot:scaffold196765_cov26-Tisochrysis_lutea.AAC.1
MALLYIGLHQFTYGFSKDSFLIPLRNGRPVGQTLGSPLAGITPSCLHAEKLHDSLHALNRR